LSELLVNQLRLYCRIEGNGPAVVLLHELGGSSLTWTALQAALAVEGFRSIALDLRGAGQSEVTTSPYSLADLGTDVLRTMDALQIPDAFVVGLAVGGLVALEVANTAQDRVRGLVLLDTPLFIPRDVAAYSRQRAEVVLREGLDSVVDLSISRSFPATVAAMCPDVVSDYRARFLKNDPRGYALASLAVLDADFRVSAPSIAVPSLVLVGEHDLLFPPEQVKALAEALPRATFWIIRDAGHFPPLQKPGEVNDWIVSFLKSCMKQGVQD
jgi:3-oxoadipate enol-lactonase